MDRVRMCTSSCRSAPTPAVCAAFHEVQQPPRLGAPIPMLHPEPWWRLCRRCVQLLKFMNPLTKVYGTDQLRDAEF
jgi:hypothetical protein